MIFRVVSKMRMQTPFMRRPLVVVSAVHYSWTVIVDPHIDGLSYSCVIQAASIFHIFLV